MKPNENAMVKSSTLWVVSLSVFMFSFMISSVNIALPAIQAEFSASAVLLSWVATAYLLASGVVLVPAGKLGDIYGRKKIFTIGIVVFSVFTMVTAFAPSIYWLITFRVLQGIGAAMSMATSMAIIADVFPVNERGKAMGVTVACVYIGYSVGPFVGGWLTSLLGWRSIFFINAPIGILSLYLSVVKIRKEWADAENERFDMIGGVLYGGSLSSMMVGLTVLPGWTGIGLVITGIIGFVIFAYYLTKTRFPILDIRLFYSNRTFTFSSLAALINYSATFAVAFLLSLYLQYVKGMTPQATGIILVSQPLVQALCSPMAGRLSDTTKPAVIASSGMGLTALMLLSFAFLTAATPIFIIVCELMILGLGFALFSSPNMNAIMSSVEKNQYGIASGTVATMRLIGQMLSMALVTLAFSLFIGDREISLANHDTFLRSTNILFLVFTITCIVGIYFSLNRSKATQQ
ncbi:MAG: MFS transporter [Pseudodesulfovibrio sp.]|nr:MFS transporter [Pseudodesulfovibrio sp.]